MEHAKNTHGIAGYALSLLAPAASASFARVLRVSSVGMMADDSSEAWGPLVRGIDGRTASSSSRMVHDCVNVGQFVADPGGPSPDLDDTRSGIVTSMRRSEISSCAHGTKQWGERGKAEARRQEISGATVLSSAS